MPKSTMSNLSRSMSKIIFTIIILFVALFACNGVQENKTARIESSLDTRSNSKNIMTIDSIPEYAHKIIDAYPEFGIKYVGGYLLFSDGTKILYDTASAIPLYLNDCGRGRNEELFKKMYGDTEMAVRKNLVSVDWFGQKIPFSKVNGASEQLGKVASELATLPQFRKFLTNASSFYWRKVRGANRQSAHSYGVAIDINTSYSNYWLWVNPNKTETDSIHYENKIPMEIVRVFEKYGFIWGGRWYHYDTMHFEYRPEFR